MKSPTRWTLENYLIGLIAHSPLIILVVVIYFALQVDNFMAPALESFFGKRILFLGFLLVSSYLVLMGWFIRTNFGSKILKFFVRRHETLALAIEGAREKSVRIALLSRSDDAPNTVMAPFRGYGGPWPFVILKVIKTSNPSRPLISGVFINYPFIFEPGTVDADRLVFADITYKEGKIYALSGGVGLSKFRRTPREVILGDFIKEERFIRFMEKAETQSRELNVKS